MYSSFQFPTGWNSTIFNNYDLKRPIVSIPNGMEFYYRHRLGSDFAFVVSIPNGMEFYPKGVIRQDSVAAFQFPTGWNSTAQARSYSRFRPRFNSQRDGILQSHKRRNKSRAWAFQFPTGWNSTIIAENTNKKTIVSIPNGMEFYQDNGVKELMEMLFQFPTGWNSTKDGKSECRSTKVSIPSGMEFYTFDDEDEQWAITVSIPNGMKFYWLTTTGEVEIERFNSQRDGILHTIYFIWFGLQIVSIPNGMEFYLIYRADTPWLILVSIPNGMEFYKSSCYRSIGAHRFQFPTGWNSTVELFCDSRTHRGFQFPTGWNSTGLKITCLLNPKRFNSQRDGILRKCASRMGRAV